MKTQKRALSFVLTLLLLLSMVSWPVSAQEPDGQKQAVDSVLQLSGATSIQYALIEGTEITVSGQAGVYSKTENRAPTRETIYGIGSVSKVYTAAAVMKLVDAGKLSLDAPLVQYLPEFKMADARYRQITVRMLLNHSSGLMGSTTGGGLLFADSSSYAKDALLSNLETQSLKADPGAYSVYCNDGFTLAEILVEKVSGKSFTQFVREMIVTPLGLSHTFTPKDSFDASLLAKTYYGTNTNALPQETLGIVGTGGIYASAEDLATFGSLFYRDTVLSQQSRDAMAAPEYRSGFWHQEEEQSLSYGLGWDNVELVPFKGAGIQALVKGGDTLNYHASLIVLPEHDMAVAVTSSGGVSIYNQLLGARLLIDALAQKGIVVDETLPALPGAKAVPMPERELAKAGLYGTLSQGLHVNLTADGQMTIDEIPGRTFGYRDDGSYRDESNSMLFKLVEASNGQVYFYQMAYAQIPGLPPMVTSDYAGQLMPENPVSKETWSAWEAISGKRFFMLSEVYSSQVYLLQPFLSLPITRNELGYFNSSVIVDSSTIAPTHQVPGVGSRDYQIITLEKSGTATYVRVNEYLTICEDSVPSIFAGDARCTIQPDGYARWYSVGASAGRQMSVALPQNSHFYVYDANGLVLSSSIFGDSGAVLPEGGFLVFLGKAGRQFQISIT